MHTTFLTDPTTAASPRAARPTTAWAWAGLATGVLGIGTLGFSSAVNAVYDDSLNAEPARILAKLAGQSTSVVLFHVCAMGAALCALVFGVGLRRQLVRRLPLGDLAPELAAVGMALVAVTTILGASLDTELYSGLLGYGGDAPPMVPEFAVVANHWIATVPWMWTGAGLAAAAVGYAALKHQAYGKGVGLVSAGLGSAGLLFSLSPLQYMCGPVAVLWLLVVSPAVLRLARRG